MLVGMLFVYAFLGVLIVVIKTVIAPLGTKFPDPVATNPRTSSTPRDSNQPDQSVVAAISAAITRYRKDHNQ